MTVGGGATARYLGKSVEFKVPTELLSSHIGERVSALLLFISMSFGAADERASAPLEHSLQTKDPEVLFKQGLQYRKSESKSCLQGHLLQEWTANVDRLCDVCFLEIPFQSQGLHCNECGHDVCSKCIALTGSGADFIKSFSFLLAAASLGHAHSQYLVGLCYHQGDGVAQDNVNAHTWMTLSAQQGFAFAQLRIAENYEDGVVIEQNYSEALKWMTLAAKQGLSEAQTRLGNYYLRGDLVEQSYDEAVKWCAPCPFPHCTFVTLCSGIA
jgi:TPR repeat protein